MNKLFLAVAALSVGVLSLTSCDSSCKNEPQSKTSTTVTFQGQDKVYQTIDGAIGITYGHDASQASALSSAITSLTKYLAPGFPSQADVQKEWTDWATNWGQWVQVAQAAEGKGGLMPKDGHDSKLVVVNGNCIELSQLFKKGFIGAYTFANVLHEIDMIGTGKTNNTDIYQNIVAYYLGAYNYLDLPAQQKEVEGEMINAYQYQRGNEFAKYLNTVNHMAAGKGLGDQFIQQLKAARNDINNDTKLKQDLLAIQQLAQKIIMVRCTFYLKSGSNKYNDESDSAEGLKLAFHNTSEGLGFVYAMQFSRNAEGQPALSRQEVMSFINGLNLWNKDDAQKKLDGMRMKLEKMYGIDDSLQPGEEH